MRLITEVGAWRAYCDEQRAQGRRLGLVPTMGALHAGHRSLFETATRNGDVVLATLFVNPRQFNDGDDLTHYPRTPDADRILAQQSGVDCLVAPSLADMWPSYPEATPTTVSVKGVGDVLEGAQRPGHFDGVASVVAKLFAITGPCRAYFGEKDYQQLAVVKQMVRDLAFDVEIVSCAIVRDPDGLALSSRNVQLNSGARQRALVLSRALDDVGATPARASEHRQRLRATLGDADLDLVYAEIVNPTTLSPSRDDELGDARALIAAVVDGVRLIDNGPVTLNNEEHECC
jgi:pantoate--beta-alanine ligase